MSSSACPDLGVLEALAPSININLLPLTLGLLVAVVAVVILLGFCYATNKSAYALDLVSMVFRYPRGRDSAPPPNRTDPPDELQ